MAGYSCLRKVDTFIRGKEAYGVVTIPTSYAGICPGDFDDSKIPQDIIPEIFFGFYCTNGIDIGIRVAGGGGWRPFCYGNDGICTANNGLIFSTSKVKPGNQLWMRAWIENVGTAYYAKINVSKVSYSGTDLMSMPLATKVSKDFGKTALLSGCDVNREITIASNPSSCESSGVYETNAIWGNCGVITYNNITYPWTDTNSYAFPSDTIGRTKGASGKYVLRLRNDAGGACDPKRIKLLKVTNVTTGDSKGATEKVSIDFRSTPLI